MSSTSDVYKLNVDVDEKFRKFFSEFPQGIKSLIVRTLLESFYKKYQEQGEAVLGDLLTGKLLLITAQDIDTLKKHYTKGN